MGLKNKTRIDALEAATELMLEILVRHQERVDELVKEREDDEDWIEAVSNDLDKLWNVVDPYGRRPGSPGYCYVKAQELVPCDEVKRVLDTTENGEEDHEDDEKLPEVSFFDQLMLLLSR